jgi:hypothetical protein
MHCGNINAAVALHAYPIASHDAEVHSLHHVAVRQLLSLARGEDTVSGIGRVRQWLVVPANVSSWSRKTGFSGHFQEEGGYSFEAEIYGIGWVVLIVEANQIDVRK